MNTSRRDVCSARVHTHGDAHPWPWLWDGWRHGRLVKRSTIHGRNEGSLGYVRLRLRESGGRVGDTEGGEKEIDRLTD